MVVLGESVVFGARRTVEESIVQWAGMGEEGWSFVGWENGDWDSAEEEGSEASWREVERRREGLSTRRRRGVSVEGGGWTYARIGGTMAFLGAGDVGDASVEVYVEDSDRMSSSFSTGWISLSASRCGEPPSLSTLLHPSVLSKDRYSASFRDCHVALLHHPTTSSLKISIRGFLSMKLSTQCGNM